MFQSNAQPLNFRTVYKDKLSLIHSTTDILQQMDELFKKSNGYGDEYLIKLDGQEPFNARKINRTGNRQYFFREDVQKTIALDKHEQNREKIENQAPLAYFQFLLFVYTRLLESTLMDSDIPTILFEYETNYISIIKVESDKYDNAWGFGSTYITLIFKHSKTKQTYSLKLPATILYPSGKTKKYNWIIGEYWQIKTSNNELVEILPTDVTTFFANS